MALSSSAKIEHELLEKVSLLSPAKKRELLNFATFLATRHNVKKPSKIPPLADFAGIIGIAPHACPLDAFFDIATECKDTDLSVNHDKYLYGDDQH
jgi:hypothetical protein